MENHGDVIPQGLFPEEEIPASETVGLPWNGFEYKGPLSMMAF